MKLAILWAACISTAFAQATNPDLPNPETLTKEYLEALTKREIGQTKFAFKSYSYGRSMPTSASGNQMESRADAPGSPERKVQEADVFKLGKAGEKELFLLNRHRGFQIVSFEDGLASPKIVGRIPVYNNWSSEMYYLEAQDRVIILNTEWDYDTNYWNSNYNTKVYMIDVKDTSAPKLIKELEVPGYLSESRMVGDVLYTISNSGSWSEQKAQITSVKIAGKDLRQIESAELHGEKEWVRTMNVVQEGAKYYVISTSSKWGNDGDTINVHDITSAEGNIEKLFTAKARGTIAERSMTFLHKDHLFAVSNYNADTNRLRVSVEAFPMVASKEVVVSKAHQRMSVGDTNGLNASLQDVRVSGDMLYAFWVPSNNRDPFELFDISNPKEGLKHLGQLQFDGWISKSFPMDYKGRKFVLGLGEVVPVTSESGKSHPQAKIFEVKKVGDTWKHEVIASLTMESSDFWSRLNTEDKFFEIVEDAPGVYNVLFPVYFKKNWKDGAKIVNVDLNAGSIREGAAVIGENGWLNRVFMNPQVKALNSFSDESLETFRQEDMSGRGFAKAVSILELSRDIVDFHVLSDKVGVQVVSGKKAVELRKVSLDKSDAEKSEVLDITTIKGKYEWHKVEAGKLILLTSFTKTETRNSGSDYSWDQEIFDYANLNVIDLATGSEKVEKVQLTERDDEQRSYYYFNVQAITAEGTEVLKISNQFFKLVGTTLKKLEIEEGCQYFFDAKSSSFSLEAVGKDIFAFTAFDVKLKNEVELEDDVESPSREIGGPRTYTRETLYQLPFTKKLAFDGSKVSCSASINVPGRPVMSKNNLLVTNEFESRYYYYGRGIHYDYVGAWYNPRTSGGKTFALMMNTPSEAAVTDIIDHDITNGIHKDGFITYSATESRLDLWRLTSEGEFLSKPQYLNAGGKNSSLITVKSFDARSFIFMKNEKKVNLYEIGKTQKLTKIPVTSSFDPDAKDGSAEYIFAIQNIEASPDLKTFHISQGVYGMTDIKLQ